MFSLGVENDNRDLRAALDEITCRFADDSLGQQIPAVAALRSQFGHDITLEREAVPSDVQSWKYTCFQHAFELVDPPRLIVNIAKFNHDIYPRAEFVAWLESTVLNTVSPQQATDDDVVLYLLAGVTKHVGRCQSGRVVSKWGLGHLWRHRLFEVPLRYGSTVRFYRPLSRARSIEAFIEWAESKLGRARMDALRAVP